MLRRASRLNNFSRYRCVGSEIAEHTRQRHEAHCPGMLSGLSNRQQEMHFREGLEMGRPHALLPLWIREQREASLPLTRFCPPRNGRLLFTLGGLHKMGSVYNVQDHIACQAVCCFFSNESEANQFPLGAAGAGSSSSFRSLKRTSIGPPEWSCSPNMPRRESAESFKSTHNLPLI